CPRATTAHIAPPSAARIPVSLHDALPICMEGEGVPLALMAQDGTGKLKRLVLTLHLVEPQHRAELFHGVGVLLPGAGLPRQEYPGASCLLPQVCQGRDFPRRFS